ncbi:cytochrome c oxidase subunit I [Piscinibacter sp.]|uniref:cytochrome c oxidase subunit I n=1 Tax=Piscinibacter sp. TaxID=1903157 RepID=UPI002C147815|nr:cytochrome c oxidase subunit I [Albitalea sp.]HUG25039.1 cytochrome c oxidase subunit I [Albitalea sp.]
MSRGAAARLHAEMDAVWGNPRGWRALTIVNHTSIGLRFMVTGAAFFAVAGVLAMLLRAQLALPRRGFMDAEAYNQAFTVHGTMMMFLFAVPMLEGLAVYLLPKMLGARDLIFPRLSAFGYWCYLFGGLIFSSSLLLGLAPNSGWFMYTPLSSQPYSPGINADFWLLGITFVEISAVAAGVELVVSILRTRAPGMALDRMPIFGWYMLVTALMIVVGFPPLILGSILLELERAAGLPFFDVMRGGDPLLWQHLFWLFGHPEVYIIFLPAAGIVSTVLPVFAQRPLVGYRWTVMAVIATGFISFGLWVHHMFVVGIPHLALSFFSAASMLVAVPTGIQIFVWLATLWTGRPLMRIPMLWIVGFLVIFVAGGLTGVMLALVPFNWQVHDTHFVVAHMHYVLVGGMLFPLIAGLYYWMPHFSGRMPSDRLARWGFWTTFIGFNGTFLVMHWTGLLGMPRRIYTYDAGLGWAWPNLVSSVFGFVTAIGLAMVLLDFVLHFRWGRPAGSNPWRADTLEWATATPPAAYNFASLPSVETRHPLWEAPDLAQGIAEGAHALPTARHGRRETLGSDPVSGAPREVVQLPGNSWLPLCAGLALAAVCVSLLLKSYATAAAATLGALAVLLRWSWENGAQAPGATGPSEVPGLKLHTRTFDGPGLWGMGVTLLANGSLFLSLVFGWLFFWTASPRWEPPAVSPVAAGPLLAAGVLLSAGALSMWSAARRLRHGSASGLALRLAGAALLGLASTAALCWMLWAMPLAPTRSAHDAVIAVLLGYLALHTGLAAVLSALQAWRVRLGHVGMDAPYEPGVVALWWTFTAVAFWIGFAALVGVPPTFRAVS